MTADPATAPAGPVPAVADPLRPAHAAPGTPARWVLLAAVGTGVVLLDQASKAAIVATMAIGDTIPLVPTLDLHHTKNRGIAFGMFQGLGDLHLPVALVVLGILLFVYRSLSGHRSWMHGAIALQVGGAIGNIIDRLHVGAVTDFISFHVDPIGFQFAVFNLADSAISIGSVILVVSLFLQREP